MKFKNKIMLYCFREEKCEEGFTTGIRYYLYNALDSLDSMCSNDLMVGASEFMYSNPRSFPGRAGYEFTFQFI